MDLVKLEYTENLYEQNRSFDDHLSEHSLKHRTEMN